MAKIEYCVGATDGDGKLTAIDAQTFPTARMADRYRLAIGRDDADVCKIVKGRITRNKAQRAVMLGATSVNYDDLPKIVEAQWYAWGAANNGGDFLQWAHDTLGWDKGIVSRTIERIGARLATEQAGPNDTALFAVGIDGQPRLVSRYGTEPPDWREARFNAGLARYGLCGETVLRLSEAQKADRASAHVQHLIAFNPSRNRKPITDPVKIMRAAAYWKARRARSITEARRQADIITRDNLLARLYNGQSVETPPSVKARIRAERLRLAFTCAVTAAPNAPTETDADWSERQAVMMRTVRAQTVKAPTALYGPTGRSAPRIGTGYNDSPECGIDGPAPKADTDLYDAVCEIADALAESMARSV